jgi:lysophospholipase L1-like esterase
MTDTIELLGLGAVPYGLAHMLTGVSVTLGAASAAPGIAGATLLDRSDPRIAVLGGEVAAFGPTYPRNLFTTTFDITNGSGIRSGSGGKLVFRTDAAAFDLRIYSTGPNSRFTLTVDGQLAETGQPAIPSDGSMRWLHFDLSQSSKAGGWKSIEIEFQGGANLGGLALPPGAAIAAAEDLGPRIVFLGDSMTEGVGAAAPGLDWPSIVAHRLGLTDVWQSGLGATGYARSWAGRPNLAGRIEADGVSAQGDIYVIAMGLNDTGSVLAEATAVFAALTGARPGAKIIALTSFNPVAPTLDTLRPIADAEIRQAAALFPQVAVLDVSGLVFTKIDGTHPDAAGHWAIADFVTAEIARLLGADGAISRNAKGDVVGPLWIENYDPAISHTFTVLENGSASKRFIVAENGSEFPELRLLPGQAVNKAGSILVTVIARGADGSLAEGTIQINVTAPNTGKGKNGDTFPELEVLPDLHPDWTFEWAWSGGVFA